LVTKEVKIVPHWETLSTCSDMALSSTGRNRLKIALLAFLKVCAEFAAQYPHKKTRNLPLILYISFNLASESNFAKIKISWKALRHIFKILNANLRI
jgi:hypothetical protein